MKDLLKQTVTGLLSTWLGLLIAAAVALLLPYWGRVADSWPWPSVVAAAFALFLLVLIAFRVWNFVGYANEARLLLRIHPLPRWPEHIESKNIGRWFRHRTVFEVTPLVTGVPQPPQRQVETILLVTFSAPLSIGTLSVTPHNMTNCPTWTAPKIDSDALLLVFDGDIPPGEQEIEIK